MVISGTFYDTLIKKIMMVFTMIENLWFINIIWDIFELLEMITVYLFKFWTKITLMDNVQEWQHPFVDIFKKYNSFEAPHTHKGNVQIMHVPIIITLGSSHCSKDLQVNRLSSVQ